MQKNGYTLATVYSNKCVSVFLHQTLSMFITDLFLLLSNDLNSIQTNTQWDLTLLFLILKSYKLWLKSIFIKSLKVPWMHWLLPCRVVLQYCLHQVRCCLFFTGRLINPTTNILDEIWGMRSIQSKRNWDYIIIIVKTLVFL